VRESEGNKMLYPISPVAKPRMTRSDVWKKRTCVMKYRNFKDQCRLHNVQIRNEGSSITFYIKMPKSWSKKKKFEMDGTPHIQVPDLSNLLKAIEDAIFLDDSMIWNYRGLEKIWAYEGSIEIF
jgi:Holliday junction resolvase RusA-like endonuclease